MLELADRLLPLLAAGGRIAAATSIDVIGSSPQAVGTSMAVTTDGTVLGAVSGGCVEDAALRECRAVLAGGAPRVRRFGFGDDAAALAGLACGGELHVLVHLLGGQELTAELQHAVAGRSAALVVVTRGLLGRVWSSTGLPALAEQVPDVPLALLRAAVDGRRETGASGSVEVACGGTVLRLFVDVAAPARRMVIGGATETAAALAQAAAVAGYRVTVCDPRAAFARLERFPTAAEVVVGAMHEVVATAGLTPRDAVCLLSHDEDLDPLALAAALDSGAGYVGAMASRSTALRRRERLRALGVPDAAITRLHMPIGLDVGARTPPELAIAVLAEVLADRNDRGAARLRGVDGPLHRPVAAG
jgi:xanthine dehydrogenase accessory factor